MVMVIAAATVSAQTAVYSAPAISAPVVTPPKRVLTRDSVIGNAMNFLYARSQDKTIFADHGGDLVWCFYTISRTSQDSRLRSLAAKMGRELALRWREAHAHVPPGVNADKVFDLVSSAYSVDRFLGTDRRLRAELRRAAARFTATDYMEFDPLAGPPPGDNPNRFKMWQNALVIAYFGDAYGIRLGARYKDVLRWLTVMHPYANDDADLEFDMFYSATHLVYTLNSYNQRRVEAALLPEETAFIKHKLATAMEDEDPEIVGESLDTLKALGQDGDPLVQQGSQYLLSHQEADGTWVEEKDEGAYTAYHAAWTAIDGLRDYRYRGEVRKLPRLATKPAKRRAVDAR